MVCIILQLLNYALIFPLLEAYFSLIVFSFLLLGSPGPAPLAIAATSAVFGIRKGFNFLFCLVIGFGMVLLIQGFAMFWLVGQNQHLMWVFQLFGFVYILFIAYKIANAPISQSEGQSLSPPSFLDGLILNLTNPKAYAAMTLIYSQMLLPKEPQSLAYLMTGAISFLVVVAIDFLWLFLGQVIRPFIQDPIVGRRVRFLFALMMVLVVLFILKNNFYA